ncbi:MAG TPA: tyrosine--tRNA ligase, partial [Verrucomicrobiales bacterium]|nr:tyrosine--tRNA ligase [Verrucomicrobiales bacterium]
SYMLLQAFDYFHLNREFGCELQIGGSDQWGNITMGIDLIRRKLGRHAFGLTLPLITKADGTKFGKTEAGAVWLDPRKTSVYRFYQFWINADDRDVIRYLKFFTFLSREEIQALEQAHAANPGAREAHRSLAWAATQLIHGEPAAREAERASRILFGGGLDGIQESTFKEILDEVPTRHLEPGSLNGGGLPLLDLLVESGLCASKGQARKDVQGGGIYLNNEREGDFQRHVTTANLLFGRHLLLRKGKRNYTVVTLRS